MAEKDHSKNEEKKIKDLIKIEHDGKTFSEDEIFEVMKNIVDNTDSEDIESAYVSTTKYVYFSTKDKKYYFNIKRKHTKHKAYHDKILTGLGIKKEDIAEDVNDDNLDSEQLTLIENKIFEKNKGEQNVTQREIKYRVEGFRDFKITKKEEEPYHPFGTQWVHDIQFDDEYTDVERRRSEQFDVLRAIILPEQRTPEWYEMRDSKITASSGATAISQNPYETQYQFILDKVEKPPFKSNKFCYHGKKYEDIATFIYEYRMNAETAEFGLIEHPKHKYLGASPDRICTSYKLDKKHKSKFVGRMLEIKCPLSRKIKMEGPIKDHICPIYYWVQVQLQLECCDLDECDFWQCEIGEYGSREEFIEDTDPNEPFRSKFTGFEKGCLIQLIPKKRVVEALEGNYDNVIFEDAIFAYPGTIELTPLDCDIWVAKMMEEIDINPKYKEYSFDRVIYWKLIKSKNVLIERERDWFAENLPEFKKVWDYVLFLRKKENKDLLDIIKRYLKTKPSVEMLKRYRKKDEMNELNQSVMSIIERLYKGDLTSVLDEVDGTKQEKEKEKSKKSEVYNDYSEYMFT